VSEQSVYRRLRSHLAYLRLQATAEQLAPALQDAERDKRSYTRFLERLLAVEVEATERRRLEGRLRFASFPTEKTLEQIDYDAQPALDPRMVEELATLRSLERAASTGRRWRCRVLAGGRGGSVRSWRAIACGC
jgi:DNA replication protein DnaC